MNSDILIDLLGREFDDKEVQDSLVQFGLPLKRPRLRRGDFDVGLESTDHGIDLTFSSVDSIDFVDKGKFPEGALILTAVFVYHDGVEGHKGYGYGLPNGLSFDQNRTQVKKLLGTPTSSSPVFPNDRWDLDKYSLIVDFSESEENVNSIAIQLPGT